MAIVTTDDIHYYNIANKIREKTGERISYRPADMQYGVEEVYDAAHCKGYDEGYDAGIQSGGADIGNTPFLTISYVDITIGANTITYECDVHNYLLSAVGPYIAVSLLSNPTVNNQLIAIYGKVNGVRLRDGWFGDVDMNTTTKAWLVNMVEGTKYRVWVATVNRSDISPY